MKKLPERYNEALLKKSELPMEETNYVESEIVNRHIFRFSIYLQFPEQSEKYCQNTTNNEQSGIGYKNLHEN